MFMQSMLKEAPHDNISSTPNGSASPSASSAASASMGPKLQLHHHIIRALLLPPLQTACILQRDLLPRLNMLTEYISCVSRDMCLGRGRERPMSRAGA